MFRLKEKSQQESFHLHREYINNYEKNVGINVNIKGHSDKILDGNEEQAITNWKKGDLFYKITKNLDDLCSSVL